MKPEKKIDKNREIRMAEIRALPESEDGSMVIEGYAIVFESPATHYGFTEIIDRNALDGAEMNDVPMRYNHNDTWLILARTRNGSLQMTVDERGLFIRAELIDTQANRDIYRSVESGLIDGMSFAFRTAKDEWDYENDLRRVLQIEKLFDVSVVDTPFYDSTSIYARALESLESGKRALESEKTRRLKVEKLKIKLRYE